MNELKLNLDKTKMYVVACSFGPDSMALLASCIKNKLNIVVAHVNYRKREASLYEQEALTKFCDERKIKIFVLDLLGVEHKGNFQEWARKKRYEFFKDVLVKENANAVLVAHQQDDLIETYLMQKNRGNVVKNPGISENSMLFGVQIIRPLLGYSKQELLEFDDQNKIPYSIDQSNLTDIYSRNKLRHQVVEKMDSEERKNILEMVKKEKGVVVEYKTTWSKSDFLNLSYSQIIKLLDFIMSKTNDHSDVSQRFVDEIKKAIQSNTNCYFDITKCLRVEIDYDDVYLVNKTRLKDYKYQFSKLLSNEIFDIDFRNGAEDRNVSCIHDQLSVKNIDKNSNFIIKDYSVSINRLFIDWKMPHFLREVWPGIYDENDKLLYIPRYRKNFVDNHKSKFVFRTSYFLEF